MKMITVTAILGGEKELGQKVKSRLDFDALIKKGIPLGVISHIKREFNLPDEVIARIIGVSPRTVSRRRRTVKIPAKERLSPVESDRVYRFARIVAIAEDVFEDKKEALEWLNNPQYGLGGRVPFDMLQTDAGAREVEELLLRIDYGVIS
jgi:putative toxin-antitoxin system antitoxin component (TIGR02293 family)